MPSHRGENVQAESREVGRPLTRRGLLWLAGIFALVLLGLIAAMLLSWSASSVRMLRVSSPASGGEVRFVLQPDVQFVTVYCDQQRLGRWPLGTREWHTLAFRKAAWSADGELLAVQTSHTGPRMPGKGNAHQTPPPETQPWSATMYSHIYDVRRGEAVVAPDRPLGRTTRRQRGALKRRARQVLDRHGGLEATAATAEQLGQAPARRPSFWDWLTDAAIDR
ncbi:MAG: hypothetical protein ACOC93_05440 [Planctomycetota bacterium]